MQDVSMEHSVKGETLADILDRVLDKGVVIAGDVTVSLVGVELLNIRLRLLIASVDKAREMGINWWETDPYLSAKAAKMEEENKSLQERIEHLEQLVARSEGQELR
ncbi:gas vesicle protein [Flexibacterium corallicola]|uniref:gas vesicle protein n=1 Tax=Flexibacterium corallicola TaxID=3037259 RepID=UPI00286F13DB|nr:gas vesicle protein [Pseudovibrio sp. M1P-2-3]